MGEYNAKLYPEPDKKETLKMKEFLKQKYTQKRFQKKEADSDDSDNDSDSDKEKKKKKAKKTKEVEEKKKKPAKKVAKKKDTSSEEEEEEGPKKAEEKVPKLLQDSTKINQAKGLKFPLGAGSKVVASGNGSAGSSSISANNPGNGQQEVG